MATTEGMADLTMEETSVINAVDAVIADSFASGAFAVSKVTLVSSLGAYLSRKNSPAVLTPNMVPPATVPNKRAAAVIPAAFAAMELFFPGIFTGSEGI